LEKGGAKVPKTGGKQKGELRRKGWERRGGNGLWEGKGEKVGESNMSGKKGVRRIKHQLRDEKKSQEGGKTGYQKKIAKPRQLDGFQHSEN